MIAAIFVVSVLVALGVSVGVARLAKDVIEAVLNRFMSNQLCVAALKYLRFAIIVVGVSSGSRVRLLDDYLGAPAWNRAALTEQLTPEVCVATVYHTVLDSLMGIAWLFFVIAFIALVALFIIRKAKPEWLQDEKAPAGLPVKNESIPPAP